jgi:hypothetical protein
MLRGGAISLVLWLGTVAPLSLVSARARAAEATKSERATARRLVAEGDAFFAQKNPEQALARYAEAYRLVHVPTVGIEVSKAQQALGKLVEALQTAREVAALPEQRGEPAVFNQARLQAAREVARLSGVIPSLLVDVAPRGVLFSVQIDGSSPAGGTPFALNPGPHHVRVSADGYQDVEQDVTLQETERQTLTVQLFPDPHATPAAGAVSTGSAAAGSPAPASAANAGAAGSGTAATAETARAPAPAQQGTPSSTVRTLGWVGIGVAGVGVAVGTFAGINALQTKPDCPNDLCSPSQQEDIDTSKTMGTIADVSFGVAIVAGALGIWALVSSSADDTSKSAALPALGPLAVELGAGPFALRLSGSF